MNAEPEYKDKKLNFTEHIFFYIGLCLILTHEMDAIQCKEWRIFPLLSGMQDEIGYLVFTALHIPLYFLLFWGIWGNVSKSMNHKVIVGLDVFFAVHVILHLLFLNNINNQFTSVFSWVLILGAGICGLMDLLGNCHFSNQRSVKI